MGFDMVDNFFATEQRDNLENFLWVVPLPLARNIHIHTNTSDVIYVQGEKALP